MFLLLFLFSLSFSLLLLAFIRLDVLNVLANTCIRELLCKITICNVLIENLFFNMDLRKSLNVKLLLCNYSLRVV